MFEMFATVVIVILIGSLAVVSRLNLNKARAEQESRYAQRSTWNAHNDFHNQQHLQQQQFVEEAAAPSNMWFE